MARKFQFNWKVTTFFVVFLVTFLRLGLWQLDREDEKRSLIAERETKLQQAPTSTSDIGLAGDLRGVPIRLDGVFNEGITLLRDNVVLNGKVGFEVHQLFEDVSGRLFLVNRGFVPMGRTRQDPVVIPAPDKGRHSLTGIVYPSMAAPMALENIDAGADGYPVIVQQVRTDWLTERLGDEVYPFVIRLNEEQPGALPRYWPDTVIPPEKHFGYAIQWFSMALAILIAWLFFSFRKEEVQ